MLTRSTVAVAPDVTPVMVSPSAIGTPSPVVKRMPARERHGDPAAGGRLVHDGRRAADVVAPGVEDTLVDVRAEHAADARHLLDERPVVGLGAAQRVACSPHRPALPGTAALVSVKFTMPVTVTASAGTKAPTRATMAIEPTPSLVSQPPLASAGTLATVAVAPEVTPVTTSPTCGMRFAPFTKARRS
jgi:hypothetical protein